MKKQLLVIAFFATGLAGLSAQESLEPIGKGCPEYCGSGNPVCCSSPGGSTFYGECLC